MEEGPESGDQVSWRRDDESWDADPEANRVVSAYLAAKALGNAGTGAQVLALVGICVWIAIAILDWYQSGDFNTSAAQRATAVLAPISILILSGLLGLVGIACRAASKWLSLSLDSIDLPDGHETNGDPSSSATEQDS